METILLLAHTEADGSLGRPALESLAVARDLAASLPNAALAAGLVGSDVQAVAAQARDAGRPLATPAEARQLLRLRPL